MDGLEREFEGEIQFVRLDADEPENAHVQQSFGLRGHPSVVLLNQDGQVVERYFGAAPESTLRTALHELSS